MSEPFAEMDALRSKMITVLVDLADAAHCVIMVSF